MSPARAIRWIESAPDLYEARLTLPDGKDVYVVNATQFTAT
jgi:hypothetical protein